MTPDHEIKSVSSETTFEFDVADRGELTRALLSHCERVATRLRKAGLAARALTLKLRTPDFHLHSRSRSGLDPTQMAPRLFAAARALLEAEPAGQAYRLIGVAAGDLAPAEGADAADLIEGDRSREKAREAAIASLARPIRRGGGAARPRLSAGRRRTAALISRGRRAWAAGRAG